MPNLSRNITRAARLVPPYEHSVITQWSPVLRKALGAQLPFSRKPAWLASAIADAAAGGQGGGHNEDLPGDGHRNAGKTLG